MYTMVKGLSDSRIPTTVSWFVLVGIDDKHLLKRLHECQVYRITKMYQRDPHLKQAMSVLDMASGWLISADRLLREDGYILVNHVGGITPGAGSKILVKKTVDKIRFPEKIEGEKITLSSWQPGTHWYLSSSKQRIFVPYKYDRFQDAWDEAVFYVETQNIIVKEPKGELPT